MLCVPVLGLILITKIRLIYLNLWRNWLQYFYTRNYVEKMEAVLNIEPTKRRIFKNCLLVIYIKLDLLSLISALRCWKFEITEQRVSC